MIRSKNGENIRFESRSHGPLNAITAYTRKVTLKHYFLFLHSIQCWEHFVNKHKCLNMSSPTALQPEKYKKSDIVPI